MFIKKHKDNKNKIKEQTIISIERQILKGLDALHSNKIIHRDIKPALDLIFLFFFFSRFTDQFNKNSSNIFLSGYLVKIGDLGEARFLKTKSLANSVRGTYPYMSPELANEEEYTFLTDIWSAGCVLYELITLQVAYDAKTQVKLIELFNNSNDVLENISTDYILLKSILYV
jgi:serine/threonine protein kinase